MRAVTSSMLVVGALLAGCNYSRDRSGPGPRNQGRYAGIGTYEAGPMWRQMADVKAPANPSVATIQDDEQIIVVIDSHSGQVRQCGNNSGVCIAMDPWSAKQAVAPVKLKAHRADPDDSSPANEASEPVVENR